MLGLMTAACRVVLFAYLAAISAQAGLPSQDQVFTIASFTPSRTNYVSADYIFSALPFYREVADSDSVSDYPSHKNAPTQQGVIVLNDKTALFFDTRSAEYLSVVDSANHSTLYRLSKTPPKRRKCPGSSANIESLPFPKPENVFCVATFPWNHGKQFSSETLIAALPHFRPLSAQDIPAKAILVDSNTGKHVFPKEWHDVQREPNPEPLHGVLVLKDRTVLKWFTWAPNALVFENYHENTYFVFDD